MNSPPIDFKKFSVPNFTGGFLIKDGIIAELVHGITIAGNLKEMFANISHVGSDLKLQRRPQHSHLRHDCGILNE